MQRSQEKSSKNYVNLGLTLTAISTTVFALALGTNVKEDDFFGIFLINYVIATAYFFTLWFSGTLKRKDSLPTFFISLVLLLISAYSLNQLIPIFESSVTWMSTMLVVIALAFLSLSFWHLLASFLKHLIAFIIGISLVLFSYLSIYLMPIYPFGLLGGIILGFSLHAFVPLLFVIFSLRWIVTKTGDSPKVKWSFGIGSVVALLVVTIFCFQWQSINKYVEGKYQHSLIDDNTDLPSWIKVSESLPDNCVTEKYLKAELVYSTPSRNGNVFSLRMPSRDFDEVRKHDPLVMIASFLNPTKALDEEERIKILESFFDARHKTQERLWRGEDLSTTNIISNIRIWPQYRIAYTEKTITVTNHNQEQRWRSEQEAIYTFHLPEGGVVSSLSLWINGVEEKGILTTKGKADSAYKQIVGVESRDPSVVHWQEGNTVSVRVFPVMSNNHRIFKIGITAPLNFNNGKLKYEPIYFDGPDDSGAKEIVQIDWQHKPDKGLMKGFEDQGNNKYTLERKYNRDWQMEFAAPALGQSAFHFNNNAYSISAYLPQRKSMVFEKVYLDINASWTLEEFNKVMQIFKQHKVYVFDKEMIAINQEDDNENLFKRLQQRRFSLFPLQTISKPYKSLLVTKGTLISPNIKDIKASNFAKNMELWLNKGEQLQLFNLGNTLSPYLKSLKEHRAYVYERGDIEQLQQLITKQEFATSIENENNIVVDNAGIVLRRTSDTTKSVNSSAPDHFQRLFTYNHLMQQLKKGIFTNQELDTALIAQAQEAHIVTPISSLIVLETVADYKRFDIKASVNSLDNASLKSKGAVPEPHEWALIILTLFIVVWLSYKNFIKQLLGKA